MCVGMLVFFNCIPTPMYTHPLSALGCTCMLNMHVTCKYDCMYIHVCTAVTYMYKGVAGLLDYRESQRVSRTVLGYT